MRTATLSAFVLAALVLAGAGPWVPAAGPGGRPAPRASDPALVVELFAAAPDVVHPISIDFDAKGRLLVVESHTHFPPDKYPGPKHDRVLALEDTDGDGKADKITTFFEGTQFTMDIAVHLDGSVYLATRNEVLRLRDTKGDGQADSKERVVFLDTKGNYPHNGLSGLCFDERGDLYFGMGENLGESYKLTGSDGTTITGQGDGGHVFHCTADGKNLRRVATGFWNPFGVCRDAFGHLFAVDNDPDAMPPCRLVHVVEGGDYGYQFRYGRSGRHPFQSWNGQLPGTLPMMSGTGEAPCEVLSYESDGLPKEYRGNLLVTSWADHRVERYAVTPQGASWTAKRLPFVEGGNDFRPVGMAVAPDGSIFLSDWVKPDYTLHGKGAIWHVRLREPHKPERPNDLLQALHGPHGPLRDKAAKLLAAKDPEQLRKLLTKGDTDRVRGAALTALGTANDKQADFQGVAERDPSHEVRAMAVRAMAARGDDVRPFLGKDRPHVVRLEAIAGLRSEKDLPRLLESLADGDPFLRNAAVRQLARHPELLKRTDAAGERDPVRRTGLLLAHRASGQADAAKLVPAFLRDPDEGVRFLAAKWVADEKLTEHRKLIAEAVQDPKLNVRMYGAYATALARLDGQDVSEAKMADYFAARLGDKDAPAAVKVMALRQVPASHPKLTVDVLAGLLASEDAALQVEAARALGDHPSPKKVKPLSEAVRNERLPQPVRAAAVVGLADRAAEVVEDLLRLARGDSPALRDEALRALVRVELTPAQRKELEQLAQKEPDAAPPVARVLGQPFFKDRPAAKDLDAWLKRLEGPASADGGQRVFANPRLAGCARCHRLDGRGADVGPDLSVIGRTERRRILESILQPSATVAPHYQAWQVETRDGKVRQGMLVHTQLDEYTYLDAKGDRFKVKTGNVVEARPLPTSIMPEGLADLLTDQELRDLLAYLETRGRNY